MLLDLFMWFAVAALAVFAAILSFSPETMVIHFIMELIVLASVFGIDAALISRRCQRARRR